MTVAESWFHALIHVSAAEPGVKVEALRADARVGAQRIHAAAVPWAVVCPQNGTFI